MKYLWNNPLLKSNRVDNTPMKFELFDIYLFLLDVCLFCLFDGVLRHFQHNFSYIVATSFSGERSRITRKEPPTMGKQLVSLITCSCESSAPFCNLQNRARIHAVLVICLYVLWSNPTTYLIEPPSPCVFTWYLCFIQINHESSILNLTTEN